MKYISPFFSDARNKLGGSVFARNPSGLYARAKVIPAQPRTPSQVANRTNFGAYANDWKALPQAVIQAWNNYAETVTLTDTLGHRFRPSGIQCYVSCSRYLGFIGAGPAYGPPTTKPIFPDLSPAIVSITIDDEGRFSYSFILDIDWDHYFDSCVFSATPQQSGGVNFLRRSLFRRMAGPYSFGGSFVILQTPYTALFAVPAVGSVIGTRLQLIDSDTGLASPVYSGRTVVTLLAP